MVKCNCTQSVVCEYFHSSKQLISNTVQPMFYCFAGTTPCKYANTLIVIFFYVIQLHILSPSDKIISVSFKMTTTNFSWLCYKKEVERTSILENILPIEYNYIVSTFKVVQESQILNETKFEAVVAINICSEEGFLNFLTAFQESSSTSYNIGRGDNKNRKNILLSGSRKCHHNVRKRTKSGNSADDDTIAPTRSDGKHTNCPARINFKLKSTEEHVHDENYSLFPLELSISFLHNHSIESANAVKYHDVSDETKNKFI